MGKHLILEQARLDALKTADASETRAASDGSVAVAKLDKAHKTTLFLRKAMRRTITKIEKMIRALFAGASEAKATGTSARRLLVSGGLRRGLCCQCRQEGVQEPGRARNNAQA